MVITCTCPISVTCMYVQLSPPCTGAFPAPTKVGLRNRIPWRKTPKLSFGAKAFSLPPSTLMEEDEVYRHPHSMYKKPEALEAQVHESPYGLGYVQEAPRLRHAGGSHRSNAIEPEAGIAVYRGGIPGLSPPISTGSCDSISSSGHDSPPVLVGEATSTVASFTPISKSPHRKTVRPIYPCVGGENITSLGIANS